EARLVVGRPVHRAALDEAEAQPGALDHRGSARRGEVGPGAGMGDAEPVEPGDRAEDRCGSVIDVVGEADRGNCAVAKRGAGDLRIGEEAFVLDAVVGRRLVEAAFEIGENQVGRPQPRAHPGKRHARVVDIHQIDVAEQDQRRTSPPPSRMLLRRSIMPAGVLARKAMIDKFVRSVAEALDGIKDGSTVLIGGFAQVGEPRALVEEGARDLTVVHNTAGRGRDGVARLIGEGRVRKIVCSFARSRGSVLFEEVYARGEIELEIVPQGTLAERLRAGGAGIPAFFTPTGAGTKLAEGKEVRVIDGRECILEYAITGDVALVEAWRADRWGNLVYRDTGRNFNPVMAAAGRLTIAQTQHV